jgi:hypothetical protein
MNYSNAVNNSATFFSVRSISINSSNIRYSIIGMFSEVVNISASSIFTTGLGYPSDSGPGCGYFD